MFRNRNFWLQIRIPWVDPVLGTNFHESRSKTDHQRRNGHFFNHPIDVENLQIF